MNLYMNRPVSDSTQLVIGHLTADPLEISQVTELTGADPAVGLGVLTGSVGLLLTLLCLRVRYLSALLQRRDRQIQRLSFRDPLTGLANRSGLCQLGTQLLKQDPDAEIALLQVNLDSFRSVNDLLGSAAGDDLLAQVSRRLQAHTRPQDTLARTGGNEFVLLLRSPSQDFALQTAKQMLQVLTQPFYVQGKVVHISGSLGVALSKQVDDLNTCQSTKAPPQPVTGLPVSFDQLLARASIARSRAKTGSRDYLYWFSKRSSYPPSKQAQGRYAVFHPVMRTQPLVRNQQQQELISALHQQELRVHYQPIVDLDRSYIVGFEALVRWQHPEQGLLYPYDFLPLAEDMDLIAAIDRWVLKAACQQLADWQANMPQIKSYLSINLSGAHLSQPGLVDYIQSLLDRYPVRPQRLNVEVTENVLITDPNRAMDTLEKIKRMGIGVSLDDFGTGYSSLSYLQQFPVDVLKIDRTFVSRLRTPVGPYSSASEPWFGLAPNTLTSPHPPQALQQSEAIIRAVIAMAEGLNIKVVAEGIEHSSQLAQLKRMGCRYGQGNLFSRSVTAQSACRLLNRL